MSKVIPDVFVFDDGDTEDFIVSAEHNLNWKDPETGMVIDTRDPGKDQAIGLPASDWISQYAAATDYVEADLFVD